MHLKSRIPLILASFVVAIALFSLISAGLGGSVSAQAVQVPIFRYNVDNGPWIDVYDGQSSPCDVYLTTGVGITSTYDIETYHNGEIVVFAAGGWRAGYNSTVEPGYNNIVSDGANPGTFMNVIVFDGLMCISNELDVTGVISQVQHTTNPRTNVFVQPSTPAPTPTPTTEPTNTPMPSPEPSATPTVLPPPDPTTTTILLPFVAGPSCPEPNIGPGEHVATVFAPGDNCGFRVFSDVEGFGACDFFGTTSKAGQLETWRIELHDVANVTGGAFATNASYAKTVDGQPFPEDFGVNDGALFHGSEAGEYMFSIQDGGLCIGEQDPVGTSDAQLAERLSASDNPQVVELVPPGVPVLGPVTPFRED